MLGEPCGRKGGTGVPAAALQPPVCGGALPGSAWVTSWATSHLVPIRGQRAKVAKTCTAPPSGGCQAERAPCQAVARCQWASQNVLGAEHPAAGKKGKEESAGGREAHPPGSSPVLFFLPGSLGDAGKGPAAGREGEQDQSLSLHVTV